MQALAERLEAALRGSVLQRYELLGVSGLKTALPNPQDLVGRSLESVGRRGKYVLFAFDGGLRVALHLSQAGRVDLESPEKATRPRGSVVRLVFEAPDGSRTGMLVREHGTQRKAGWWVLAPGDEGPLATLGPDPYDPAFAKLLMAERSGRRLNTWLRDQRVVAGIGRGYADDSANLACLSPFAPVGSISPEARGQLLDAVRSVLDGGLARERERTGGLSEPKLGGGFSVHGRSGEPCPRCGETLSFVSYESHEIVYCRRCQTKGKTLADRRLSRLLR
jgi:formamidopyrimidine-DNA glycosylase